MSIDLPDTPPAKDSVLVVGADGVGRYVPLDTFTRTGVQDPPVVSHPGSVPADAPTFGLDAFAWSGAWEDGDGERFTKTDGSATVKFTGGYLVLLGTKDTHHGQLSVSIAGKAASSMSVTSANRETRAVVFEATGLGDGVKTAVISGTGVRTLAGGKAAGIQKPDGATTPTQPTTQPPTTNPGTSTPPATTSPAGRVVRNPDKAELLLDGKPYKFVGANGVKLTVSADRAFTDYEAYYRDTATGWVDRAWFLPHMSTDEMDRIVGAARKYRARLVVSLFDHANGVKMDAVKSGWGSQYRAHVERVVGRYKDDPTVIMWETSNEPPVGDRAGFDLVGKQIKTTGGKLALVCTGTTPAWNDAGVAGWKNGLASEFVDVGSIHEYDTKATGASPHLARHLGAARELKKPIYVGEFGIDANRDGSGRGDTAGNGAVTFEGRAKLLQSKTDAYLGTPEVCGVAYWSVGRAGQKSSADSYMPVTEKIGIAALQALAKKWNRA